MNRAFAIKLLNGIATDINFYRFESQVIATKEGYETAFKLLSDKLREMDNSLSNALDDAGENVATNNVNKWMKEKGY